MATIYPFTMRTSDPPPKARKTGNQATAELIFFPGVRYERTDSILPPTRKKSRRKTTLPSNRASTAD